MPNLPTAAELEAALSPPKVTFRGDEYQLKVYKFTNKMLRHLDKGNITLILDELIGEQATDAFVEKYDDPEDLGNFLKETVEAIGTKNS